MAAEALKKSFFACYDYGTGGVWCLVQARSANEITAKYPFFTVLEARPSWMSDDYLERISSKFRYDIDDEPSDLIAAIIQDEKRI